MASESLGFAGLRPFFTEAVLTGAGSSSSLSETGFAFGGLPRFFGGAEIDSVSSGVARFFADTVEVALVLGSDLRGPGFLFFFSALAQYA